MIRKIMHCLARHYGYTLVSQHELTAREQKILDMANKEMGYLRGDAHKESRKKDHLEGVIVSVLLQAKRAIADRETLTSEKRALESRLAIAIDRLDMIATNTSLSSGTARKLTAIANSALEEINE